ncbi:SRPBCC family protein [Acinetobacter terrestris]|uniref:SRPBCC family protein n=1 Tax=Acinetobacter terrestris TaxID=2529843 RepID=UPI003525B2DC
MPSTVKLHRVFTAPPERVFRAFIDPDALVKWMAPHGFTAKVHHLDAKVGGSYKMSFSNFTTGTSQSFGGTYHEIMPNQLLRYTDQFNDPNLPGQIEVTIQFHPVSVGTEVHITQSGIPDVIPAEACYLGWQESLQLLTLLVNAEIPDQ